MYMFQGKGSKLSQQQSHLQCIHTLFIYISSLLFSLSLLSLSPEIPLANTMWWSFRTATCTFLFVLNSYIHMCTFLFVYISRISNMCPFIDFIVTAVASHRSSHFDSMCFSCHEDKNLNSCNYIRSQYSAVHSICGIQRNINTPRL